MGRFKPATKKQSKLRLALIGPAGSGKTFSALSIASGLGKKIALIDTEHGSASLYADQFNFDTCILDTFSPDAYVEAIKDAEADGYDVIVIDSLSHAWIGKDGALEQVDNATRRSASKNSYFAWRDVTPKHNALVEAILQCKAHLIATMRAKTEYTVEKDEKGKLVPRKIGMAPIQREGMDYEFSISGELDLEHNYTVTKTRCSVLANKVIHEPGLELAQTLKAWLEAGAPEARTEARFEAPSFASQESEEAGFDDESAPPLPPQPEPAPAPAPVAAATTAPAPSGSPHSREEMKARIRACRSMDALEALVPEIQRMADLDRAAVRPDYARRKTDLARGLVVPEEEPAAARAVKE